MRKTCAERRKITLMEDGKIRKRFEEKVTELVDVGASDLRGHIKDGDQRHVMRCVGRRGGGEVREMHGCGMKM